MHVWRISSIALGDCISKGNIAAFNIQFGFGWHAKHSRTRVIEFTLPSGDYDCRQTVANHVDAGAAHVHQFIDTENNGHTDGS